MLRLGNSITSETTPFENLVSLEFDGVNDYLDLGDTDDFSFGDGSNDQAFSMSIWYKAADVTSMPLISKTTSTSAEREYYMYISGADKLAIALFDTSSGGYLIAQTAAVTSTQGSWNHVVFTYDGNKIKTGLKIYLNGEAESVTYSADGATIGSGAYTAMENTAFPLYVGNFPLVGYKAQELDEFSMWNIELTSAKAEELYNSGDPTDLSNEQGLIGWWRMGDTAIFPTIPDASTNSNNGTMTNMSSSDITTDVPSS